MYVITPASFLSKINLSIIALLVIAVLFLGWRLESTKGTIQQLENNLDAYASSLNSANESIKEVNKQIKQLALDKQKHEKKVFSITASANERILKLEGNRAKENVVLAKPGLTETKINAAFKKQQDKLSCVTGNIEVCEK